jgi:hypothetical protein
VIETAIRSQNEDDVRLLAQRVNSLLVQADMTATRVLGEQELAHSMARTGTASCAV